MFLFFYSHFARGTILEEKLIVMVHIDAAFPETQLALRVEPEKLIAAPTVAPGDTDLRGIRPAECVETLHMVSSDTP